MKQSPPSVQEKTFSDKARIRATPHMARSPQAPRAKTNAEKRRIPYHLLAQSIPTVIYAALLLLFKLGM